MSERDLGCVMEGLFLESDGGACEVSNRKSIR